MVWPWLILILTLIGLVCVSLSALRHWEFRHCEEGTISGALCQLALWFAMGAASTYLLGVLCASLRGYDGWRSIGAILGGFLVGLGVMALIAVPLFNLAMGMPRQRAFRAFMEAKPPVAIALGLLAATFPVWCPSPLGQFATPELRHRLVHELKHRDESIRLQSADLLADFGTPEEIPALKTALKKAEQSGDRELEQKCNRAMERIRRR